MRINFCTYNLTRSNCHIWDNLVLKMSIIGNNVCNNRMSKPNVAFVGACACDGTPFFTRPDSVLIGICTHLTKRQIQEPHYTLRIIDGTLTLSLEHLILIYWLVCLAVLSFPLIIQNHGLKVNYIQKTHIFVFTK